MAMEQNPFEPPASELRPSPDEAPGESSPFVIMPVTKLIWVSIASCALFPVVWFYRNFRRSHGVGGALFATLFAGITCFELFKSVTLLALEHEVTPSFRPGVAGALVLALGLAAWGTPAPFKVLVSLLSVAPLIPVQATINAVASRSAPGEVRDEPLGVGGVIVLVLGALSWIGIIFGSTMAPA